MAHDGKKVLEPFPVVLIALPLEQKHPKEHHLGRAVLAYEIYDGSRRGPRVDEVAELDQSNHGPILSIIVSHFGSAEENHALLIVLEKLIRFVLRRIWLFLGLVIPIRVLRIFIVQTLGFKGLHRSLGISLPILVITFGLRLGIIADCTTSLRGLHSLILDE